MSIDPPRFLVEIVIVTLVIRAIATGGTEMKIIKMALLVGTAIAISTAGAHADDLSDLKAQVESLNVRMAAMEAAPTVPTGYELLAIAKGEALQVPGMMGADRDRVVSVNATIMSVMPTADAPAGTKISWSGYVRAAIVYNGTKGDNTLTRSDRGEVTEKVRDSTDINDWDVKTRGQLQVVATTDTAVGEVGVKLKMRADFDGNGNADLYMKEAWGYWAMTPELTLGGGYTKSLGNILYGYDGACTCYYTDDKTDVDFDPGDTTQMRLSYASGPFSMAIALEDASKNNGLVGDKGSTQKNGNNLGVAGAIKYKGDSFSGEIAGVYRSVNDSDYTFDDPYGSGKIYPNINALWQLGAGLAFDLGDLASLSLAAAFGEGPYQTVGSSGDIYNSYPVNNKWWGLSGLASANLSDTVHAETGLGYKHREGDSYNDSLYHYDGFSYDTWAILGGVYYTPVDQLTIGVEGEWYTQMTDDQRTGRTGTEAENFKDNLNVTNDNWTVDLVSVWRF